MPSLFFSNHTVGNLFKNSHTNLGIILFDFFNNGIYFDTTGEAVSQSVPLTAMWSSIVRRVGAGARLNHFIAQITELPRNASVDADRISCAEESVSD